MISIYFIRCGKKGPIKIGYAKDVEKRMADLQIGNPYQLFLIAAVPVKSMAHGKQVEKWLHQRFKTQHIRGEWFRPTIKLKPIFRALEALQ